MNLTRQNSALKCHEPVILQGSGIPFFIQKAGHEPAGFDMLGNKEKRFLGTHERLLVLVFCEKDLGFFLKASDTVKGHPKLGVIPTNAGY